MDPEETGNSQKHLKKCENTQKGKLKVLFSFSSSCSWFLFGCSARIYNTWGTSGSGTLGSAEERSNLQPHAYKAGAVTEPLPWSPRLWLILMVRKHAVIFLEGY